MDGSSIGGSLFVLACLLFGLLKSAGLALQALRQRRSRSWPWAQVTIDGGSVKLITQGRSRLYELQVSYSYSVDGKVHSGTYRERFGGTSEAESILKSLRELPPPARYNPGDPRESVMDPYRDAGLAVTTHG